MDKLRNLMANNAVLTIIFGILMILMPGSLLQTAIRIAGVVVLVYGACCIYQAVATNKDKRIINIVIAIVAILVGVRMISQPAWFVGILPQAVGCYLILSGILKLAMPLAAIPDLLLGIILVTNAFGLMSLAVRVVGIFVLAIGIADLKLGN